MSMPAITKHLKVLEKAGLITREKSAQRRPCIIRPSGFQSASNWILEHQNQVFNDSRAGMTGAWTGSLDRLEAVSV